MIIVFFKAGLWINERYKKNCYYSWDVSLNFQNLIIDYWQEIYWVGFWVNQQLASDYHCHLVRAELNQMSELNESYHGNEIWT